MPATTSRMLTGWGRVAPSTARVTGPLELTQLQDLVASAPAGGILARGAGQLRRRGAAGGSWTR